MSKVVIVVNCHPKPCDRHELARVTRNRLVDNHDAIVVEVDHVPAERSSKSIGDERDLPYLKDLLDIGITVLGEESKTGVVIWTNDDVQLMPEVMGWANSVVRLHGAMSMRRDEKDHIGRELFAFTLPWLQEHLKNLPDFFMGCPAFDLVIAAYIRKTKGINSTLANMLEDIYPCDSEERFAIHPPHESSWAGKKEYTYPANNHNRALAKEWCKAYMPSLQL